MRGVTTALNTTSAIEIASDRDRVVEREPGHSFGRLALSATLLRIGLLESLVTT